jgi:hypothetical protein
MKNRESDAASQPDDENPEWMAEEFQKARPALEVIGEAFGAKAAETSSPGPRQTGEA